MAQRVHPAGSVSRRGFFKMVVVGAGAACLASGAETAWAAEGDASGYPSQVKIAVMSDLHYFSPTLWSDCPDYTTAENSDRKMFKESAAILDAALASVVAAQPDVVLVPGDLTKDSELVCHQEAHAKIAAAREKLKAAGVETKFFVINGNHDVNNSNGLDFSSGSAVAAQHADPATFKQIWADCGYDDSTVQYAPNGSGAGSLSYVARPAEGFTLIVVDSCKYSADQTDSGADEHETSGVVGLDLLSWVVNQASKARAAGDVVAVMQHHGVVPHFDDEPTLLGEYLVDNYETVAPAYADAGVSVVFTGHMHANDVAAYTSPAGCELFDVETDSLVTYPSFIRTGTLSWRENEGALDAVLAVNVASLGSVAYGSYADKITGASNIADITEYGRSRTLTQDVVDTIAKDYLSQYMTQIYQSGGVKPTIAGLLGVEPDGLGEAVFSLVAGMLPQTFESGMQIALSSFNFSIWYDASTARVKIDQYKEVTEDLAVFRLESPAATELGARLEERAVSTYAIAADKISLYVDAAGLTAFLDDVCAKVDASILADPSSTHALVDTLVDALLNHAVDEAGNTVIGLVDYAYQTHLRSSESCEEWAETAIAKVAGGEGNAEGLLMEVLRSSVNTAQPELVSLLEKVKLDITLLVMKGNSEFMTTMALSLLKTMVKDAGDIVGLVVDDNSLGDVIPDIPALSAFAHSALYTLSHDSSVQNDHDFSFTTRVKDAVSGGGSGDGSGDGSGSDGGSTGGSGNGSESNGNGAAAAKRPSSLAKTGDSTGAVALGAAAVAGVGVVAAGAALRGMKEHEA